MIENDWATSASCREVDPELWFPSHGGNGANAVRICQGCPVQNECLDDVLAYEKDTPLEYRWGIVAGLDPRQRVALTEGSSPHCGTMRGVREHNENGEDHCKRCKTAEHYAEYRKNFPRQRKVN